MADEPIVESQEEVETAETDENEQQEDKTKSFQGEYDPERARNLIDKLRKENNDLRKQKDAPKSDPEKEALARENLQLKVAMELGIPEKLATRLQGATREELLEDAADLMDTVAPRKPKTNRPQPRLKGGSQPEEEPELSAKDIAAGLRI